MLSIFTPTYNRAYLLPRLYESLLTQSNMNFEWIIVDDGSTDDTKKIVKSWQKDNKINIRYFYQKNQGKQMAHNKGVKESNGVLFLCVDSDDYLSNDAVEIILKKYKKIEKNKKYVGIVGIKKLISGEPCGTLMPANVVSATLYDLYNKYHIKGDTLLVYKTEAIKKYEFPKIENEKFIPESYLYDKIDQDGELFVIPEALYICEYLSDGYSHNIRKLIANNPIGYKLYAAQYVKISSGIKMKFIATCKYVVACFLSNDKNYFLEGNSKLITLFAIPVAYFVLKTKYRKIKRGVN